MSDELIQRVRSVIATAQRLPLEKVTIESTFEELGIDSMDGMTILFAVESEFDISVSDEDAKSIHTVRQMAEGVEKLLAAKSSGSATA